MKISMYMAATVNGIIARENGKEDFLSDYDWDIFVKLAKKLYEHYINTLKKYRIKYFLGLVKKDNYKIQKILNKFKMKKRDLCYFYDGELE